MAVKNKHIFCRLSFQVVIVCYIPCDNLLVPWYVEGSETPLDKESKQVSSASYQEIVKAAAGAAAGSVEPGRCDPNHTRYHLTPSKSRRSR
jgi:hypothetical protein